MKTRVGFNKIESIENMIKNSQRLYDIYKVIEDWESADVIDPIAKTSLVVTWNDDNTEVIGIRNWGNSPIEKVNEYLTLSRSMGADIVEIFE